MDIRLNFNYFFIEANEVIIFAQISVSIPPIWKRKVLWL